VKLADCSFQINVLKVRIRRSPSNCGCHLGLSFEV